MKVVKTVMGPFQRVVVWFQENDSDEIAYRLVTLGYTSAWLIAAAISWRTIRDASHLYLGLPWGLDWLYPLVVDAPLLVQSGAIWLSRRQNKKAGFVTWMWLLVFAGLSAFANIVAHGWDEPITVVMAALPPAAAVISLERGARQFGRASLARSGSSFEPPPLEPYPMIPPNGTGALVSESRESSVPVSVNHPVEPSSESSESEPRESSVRIAARKTSRSLTPLQQRLWSIWNAQPDYAWSSRSLRDAVVASGMECSQGSANRFLQKRRTETPGSLSMVRSAP